ncbi:MAG: hypothetical protein KF851_08550 [Pirellulaceae bacterium]|nr:hypothetical protein [Pirellulaceae bacterium]
MTYRYSKYIDFDAGVVKIAPMELASRKTDPLTIDDKIDLFGCRVDVWQLGTAVASLMAIEFNHPPSIWSHAAYGLLACSTSYFEMIGKTLNPNSKTSGTAGIDFNYGFCDVYPSFAAANGSRQDNDVPHVKQFRDRLRNGLYHLAFTKRGLWIHNNLKTTTDEFHVTSRSPPEYLVNPHRMVRSLVAHFPTFINRVIDPNNSDLRGRFETFFDHYHK